MLKKNLLGILIVIMIAAAFVGGYLVGRGTAPQMSPAQRMAMMAGRQAGSGGQSATGQSGNASEQRPSGQPAEQNEPGTDANQRPQAGQPVEGQGGEPVQRSEQPSSTTQPSIQQPSQGSAATPVPDANTYTFYGTAAPSAEVNVQSKQGGTIIMLKGKEGDSVTKGELLVQFDDSEEQLNLEKARSSRNSTLQQVQQAETNLKAARTNLERNQQLFNDGLISQQQMDDLRNNVEAAQASLNSARETLKQADTQIALLEKGLENFVVRAPISGIINQKNYNLQEIYRANDVLYHLVSIDEVYINVDVPETYIKQIGEGMQAAVTFNALGKQRFSGIVETVLPSGSATNRTFTVKVLVQNPEHAIKPGMFTRVEFALEP